MRRNIKSVRKNFPKDHPLNKKVCNTPSEDYGPTTLKPIFILNDNVYLTGEALRIKISGIKLNRKVTKAKKVTSKATTYGRIEKPKTKEQELKKFSQNYEDKIFKLSPKNFIEDWNHINKWRSNISIQNW